MKLLLHWLRFLGVVFGFLGTWVGITCYFLTLDAHPPLPILVILGLAATILSGGLCFLAKEGLLEVWRLTK